MAFDGSTPMTGSLVLISGTQQAPAFRFPGGEPLGFFFDGSAINVVGTLKTHDLLPDKITAGGDVVLSKKLTVLGETTVSGTLNVSGTLKANDVDAATAQKIFEKTGNATELFRVLINKIFPIGSILYNSGNNPASYLGVGTWVHRNGRVIVGVDQGVSGISSHGQTGGSRTVKIQERNLPPHYHGVPGMTLYTDSDPGHGHDVYAQSGNYNDNTEWNFSFWNNNYNIGVAGSREQTQNNHLLQYVTEDRKGHKIIKTGGVHKHRLVIPSGQTLPYIPLNDSINIMTPYYCAYIWERTA